MSGDEAPGDSTALEVSRAFERVRGLTWVGSTARWLGDTIVES